jgi:hypothetical protein
MFDWVYIRIVVHVEELNETYILSNTINLII